MIGKFLAHYEVTALLGKGGMGEVYRARDTQLDRDVAVKLLPIDFAKDPERRRRLEREAKLLATLEHPNIAAIYGLHEEASDHTRFLAMELVEGTTLEDRLKISPLSIEESLDVTSQIANALEAAHDRGIVHRDLKPSNVQLRVDGVVKVLDFGLARATTPGTSAWDPDAPTSFLDTEPGTVLGTAPYMSPEQAAGRSVDKRTDIWALGCILFECLSGRRAFEGDSAADLLTKIASENPDLDRLPENTPTFVVGILRRCFEKDPRMRLRDAGELRVAIENHLSMSEDEIAVPARGSSTTRTLLPWALVILLLGLLGYSLRDSQTSPETDRPISRWRISAPDGSRVGLPGPGGKFDYSNVVAISPDGSKIAFSVLDGENRTLLYVKDEGVEPRPVPGTLNARSPVFSPDGKWLAFYSTDSFWKVALSGGSPQRICMVEGRAIEFDAAWSSDGETIVFTDDGLWSVSVSSGIPRRLTSPDPEREELGHHLPRFAADGLSILFTVSKAGKTHLALLAPDTSDWELILEDATMGVPLGDDGLVFARGGELFAAPFDQKTPRVTGSIVPIFQGVHTSPGLGGVVVTWFDISRNGTLVYVPADLSRPDEQLLWVERDGSESVIARGRGTWVHPRLSPDGTRISIDIHTPDGMRDVHIYDLGRGQFQQLTKTGVSWESEWRPDGAYLSILSGIHPGTWSLYQVRTDFSGPPELVAAVDHAVPGSWIDESRAILFTDWASGGIFRVRLGDHENVEQILAHLERAGFPRLSPDGNWLAFVASESSSQDVFVTSYPETGAMRKVSIGGGREPVWSHDGSQLFYRRGDEMVVVDVSYDPAIGFGQPRVLFEGVYDGAEVGHQHYDISQDASRFLMVKHGEPTGPRHVGVVLNWSEELSGLWE